MKTKMINGARFKLPPASAEKMVRARGGIVAMLAIVAAILLPWSASAQVQIGNTSTGTGGVAGYYLTVDQYTVSAPLNAYQIQTYGILTGTNSVTLYSDDGNNFPGTKLFTEVQSVVTANGFSTINIPNTYLAPGKYWIAFNLNSNSAFANIITKSTGVTGAVRKYQMLNYGTTFPATLTEASWISAAAGTEDCTYFVGTNVPPVAKVAAYNRAKNTAIKISITNLIAKFTSDSPGDTVGLVSVAGGLLTNNMVIATTTNGSSVYIANPYAGSSYIVITPTTNRNETFPYVVNDTSYPALTATNLITITVTNAIGTATGSISVSGGAATTTWAGIPSNGYNLQRSTNLTVGTGWVTIWTTNAPTAGVFSYKDSFTGLTPIPLSAYYRLQQQ